MAKIWFYTIIFYMWEYSKSPPELDWDYVVEGSKKKEIGLWPTYLPYPQSSILMPKPPCIFVEIFAFDTISASPASCLSFHLVFFHACFSLQSRGCQDLSQGLDVKIISSVTLAEPTTQRN
jgi:hypothetical protein